MLKQLPRWRLQSQRLQVQVASRWTSSPTDLVLDHSLRKYSLLLSYTTANSSPDLHTDNHPLQINDHTNEVHNLLLHPNPHPILHLLAALEPQEWLLVQLTRRLHLAAVLDLQQPILRLQFRESLQALYRLRLAFLLFVPRWLCASRLQRQLRLPETGVSRHVRRGLQEQYREADCWRGG